MNKKPMNRTFLFSVMLLPCLAFANDEQQQQESSQFKSHPRCDGLVQQAMIGWNMAEEGKSLDSIIAIKNQQHRMLALQGYVVHNKGVNKEESYLFFFTKCLEAHGNDLTTNGERI